MVKPYCNVDAIVEQLLNLLTLDDNGNKPCIMSENGKGCEFVASHFRRIKGRLQIVGYDKQVCNWRLSERTLDAIALRVVVC